MMVMEGLAGRRCVPCEGGVPALFMSVARKMMKELHPGWQLQEGKEGVPPKLVCASQFRNFKEALAFVNKVGAIAEAEGHHPDIEIHYNRVALSLYTHAIRGLHENDFILAAKIDQLG